MESHGGAVSRKVKKCKLGFRKFRKYSGMEAQHSCSARVAFPPCLREVRRAGVARKDGSPRPCQWLQVNRLLRCPLL